LTEESKQVCEYCKKKEAEHLQYELSQCQKTNKIQNQKIQKLDKKVFILMCCVVAIGAVFGKETLDSLIEWLESLNSIKTQVDDLTAADIPGPGALLLLSCAPLATRPRRK